MSEVYPLVAAIFEVAVHTLTVPPVFELRLQAGDADGAGPEGAQLLPTGMANARVGRAAMGCRDRGYRGAGWKPGGMVWRRASRMPATMIMRR